MSTDTKQSTESDSTDVTPPDRGCSWREVDVPYLDSDESLYGNGERIETNRSNYSSMGKNQIAYYPVDSSQLREQFDVVDIAVPQYYSRFDGFDTHVSTLDTGGNHVAWGVTPNRLEDTIRVAVDGGRYRSDDLSVFALESEPIFVVDYDGQTWVVSCENLRSLPDGYKYDTTQLRGFTVPDDSDTVLRGMGRFLDLLPEHYGEEVVAYDHLTNSGYHYFKREDGSTFAIGGNYLKKLGRVAFSPDEVQTEYEIETKYGKEYSVSWDEVTCEIGDYVGKIYGRHTPEERDEKECVAGYQFRWEDPRTSSRVSMTGKIKCKATYIYILYRDRYDRYEVRDRDETIAEFEPRNEDWTPY